LKELNLNSEDKNKKPGKQQTDDKNPSSSTKDIEKIKHLNNLNEIIGITNMSEKEAEEYIKTNKIPREITYIIDNNNEFNKLNDLDMRYEIVLDNMVISEYRPDPNLLKNILLFIALSLIILVIGRINYKEYKNIYSSLIWSSQTISYIRKYSKK
jgi:hypothetical protein